MIFKIAFHLMIVPISIFLVDTFIFMFAMSTLEPSAWKLIRHLASSRIPH